MKKLLLILFLGIFLFSFPSDIFSKIGVGVGTGKIIVEDELKPGMSYELPPLTVLNTGDEASDYEVEITYHQDQPELEPSQDWFDFNPKKFYLEPGESQSVEIKLDLPVKAEPGDYFAYLEGHPVKKSETEGASIGVAAAAKLYFKIVPATLLEGIYYKVKAFWTDYSPWTNIVAGVVVVALLLVVFLRFFKFQVQVGRKKTKSKDE